MSDITLWLDNAERSGSGYTGTTAPSSWQPAAASGSHLKGRDEAKGRLLGHVEVVNEAHQLLATCRMQEQGFLKPQGEAQ